MSSVSKLINFVVGVILIIILFKFFVGSGVGDIFIEPMVAEGKLGAPTGSFFAGVIELAFSAIAWLGAFGIWVGLKGARYIADLLQDLNEEKQPKPTVGNSSSDLSPGMLQDLSRLLVQSAIDADKQLTIATAEKLAGVKYLTANETKVKKDQEFSNSFPSN